MKARLVLPAVATAAALALAGCGDSRSSSGSDPAALAPPQSPLYIAATVRPEGELKTNLESVAQTVAGVDDLGGRIVSELESSSGEELDYEKEVEPWLGERGGLFFQRYDGDDFSGYGVAIETADPGASQDFIDKQAGSSEDPVEDGSYEGVDFKSQVGGGTTIGVIGDFVAIAEDERTFKRMVDASGGESLADEDLFARTVAAAAEGSLADVFVNIGRLIDQSGDAIDPDAELFLDSAGIDPDEATAVASLTPGSNQVEIEISTDLGGGDPPGGDASALLGALPADSVAAVASTGFGARFGEALDQIDADGIPGEVPPGEFKSTLKEAGIDVEKIAASIGDVGVFAEGESEGSLAGAVVLEMKSAEEARNTVSNAGLLLRASGTPGVTPPGGTDGDFSVRGTDLGPRRLVVASGGKRIVIAYGPTAAMRAMATGSNRTLADTSAYKEAVNALGGTPISGFADGPAALKLASDLIPADDAEDFREAKPYLAKIDFLAIGSGSSEGLATATLIAGLGK